MPLSRKQQLYLHEMGITLWSERHTSAEPLSENTVSKNHIDSQTTPENNEHSVSLSLDTLSDSILLSDILHAFGYSLGECQITNNTLSFDLFSWVFTQNQDIQLQNNQLSTPELDVIAKNTDLKKQLWQCLSSVPTKA